MSLSEAKNYIGKVCSVRYQDRSGQEHLIVSKIYDATYVPLYGGYLVTDADDIRFDRIHEVSLMSDGALATSGVETLIVDKVAA